jgi:hypothetical protein
MFVQTQLHVAGKRALGRGTGASAPANLGMEPAKRMALLGRLKIAQVALAYKFAARPLMSAPRMVSEPM